LNTGTSFSPTIQDYVIGFAPLCKDHLTQSITFGPDGKLYLSQGSNSAMGAPDAAWFNRAENLLSGAILQIDPRADTT
jgi:glucose/arabinose dehydrogenase